MRNARDKYNGAPKGRNLGANCTTVCLRCRTTFKHNGSCGIEGHAKTKYVNMGKSFKSPGKRDEKFWRKLEFIVAHGLYPSHPVLSATPKELMKLAAKQREDEQRQAAVSRRIDQEHAISYARPPDPPPVCANCGFTKLEGHTGRRGKFKCYFSPGRFVAKEMPVEDPSEC